MSLKTRVAIAVSRPWASVPSSKLHSWGCGEDARVSSLHKSFLISSSQRRGLLAVVVLSGQPSSAGVRQGVRQELGKDRQDLSGRGPPAVRIIWIQPGPEVVVSGDWLGVWARQCGARGPRVENSWEWALLAVDL